MGKARGSLYRYWSYCFYIMVMMGLNTNCRILVKEAWVLQERTILESSQNEKPQKCHLSKAVSRKTRQMVVRRG